MVTKIEDSLDACLMVIQAEDTSAVSDLTADFMEIDEVSVPNIYDLDYVIVKLCDCCKVQSSFYVMQKSFILRTWEQIENKNPISYRLLILFEQP